MTYEGDLQQAIDMLFYNNRSRDRISSSDDDLLAIFSGDEQAAEVGLRAFYERHAFRNGRETGKVEIVSESPVLEIKVFSLFEDPEQRIQREKYVQKQKRFREGRWPEQRPYRRGRPWKR